MKLKEVGIRQAEAEAKAKVAEAKAKEADSENLRLRGAGRVRHLIGASKFSTYPYSYCGKAGHKAEVCWTRLQLNTGKPVIIVTEETNTSPVGVMADLSKADSMLIGLVFTKGEVRESAVSILASRDFDPFQESFVKDPDVGAFRPFLSQGTVEVDGVETPVTILRDSGCRQTLIIESVVAARKTDKYVVLGSHWGQGIANVACVPELPVAGVDLILGNDLAGGQMGNVTPPPVLLEKPDSTVELQQLEDDMPGVSPLCAVTRSMLMTNDHNVTPVVEDSLSLEGLFANPIASQDISSAVNAVIGRVALIAAQEQDDSLRLLQAEKREERAKEREERAKEREEQEKLRLHELEVWRIRSDEIEKARKHELEITTIKQDSQPRRLPYPCFLAFSESMKCLHFMSLFEGKPLEILHRISSNKTYDVMKSALLKAYGLNAYKRAQTKWCSGFNHSDIRQQKTAAFAFHHNEDPEPLQKLQPPPQDDLEQRQRKAECHAMTVDQVAKDLLGWFKQQLLTSINVTERHRRTGQ
ncbi:hypothetical protein Hamer_G007933, partial [Homarus americanus]